MALEQGFIFTILGGGGLLLQNGVHLLLNVTYFNSQPWPFPDSLMVAFTADYDSGEIVIDNNEISEAALYRYDQLPGLPSMQYSIAFTLIHDFIADCAQEL
ncbi:MAG: hypothetical protein WCR08_03990 [Gammaproteobacteria bacterium]